jgi:hypothetical protein
MFLRKGRGYYTRRWTDGNDRWLALGPDFDEACRKLRNAERSEVPVVRLTLKEAAAKWLETYVAKNRAPKQRVKAAQRVRDYFEPFMGYKLLSRVDKEDLRAMRLWLKRQEKKPLSVRHILADVKCFFRWCEDASWLDRAPIQHRLLPKSQERPPDRLDDADVERLLSVPEPYAFIVRLALGTGLRWGELARLNSNDLEVARSEGEVRRASSWCVTPSRGEFAGFRCNERSTMNCGCGSVGFCRSSIRWASLAWCDGIQASRRSTRISYGTHSRAAGWNAAAASRRCNKCSATRPS